METAAFGKKTRAFILAAIFLLGLISFIFPLGTNPLNARNIVHIASVAFCIYPALVLFFSGRKNAFLLVLGSGAFLAGNLLRGAYELAYSRSIPTIAPSALLFSAGQLRFRPS